MDTSSIRIGLKFVPLDLGTTSARICSILSFKENPDSFVFHFATWFSILVRSVPVCVRKRTELATNFLHESDKLVSGSLVLLAPE